MTTPVTNKNLFDADRSESIRQSFSVSTKKNFSLANENSCSWVSVNEEAENHPPLHCRDGGWDAARLDNPL